MGDGNNTPIKLLKMATYVFCEWQSLRVTSWKQQKNMTTKTAAIVTLNGQASWSIRRQHECHNLLLEISRGACATDSYVVIGMI